MISRNLYENEAKWKAGNGQPDGGILPGRLIAVELKASWRGGQQAGPSTAPDPSAATIAAASASTATSSYEPSPRRDEEGGQADAGPQRDFWGEK